MQARAIFRAASSRPEVDGDEAFMAPQLDTNPEPNSLPNPNPHPNPKPEPKPKPKPDANPNPNPPQAGQLDTAIEKCSLAF